MCGRYRLKDPDRVLEALRAVFGERLGPVRLERRWNIAPSQQVTVLHPAGDQVEGQGMRWGFVPPWDRSEKPRLAPINARSEEAFGKPLFREAVRSRRCLVPADGFYEWQRTGETTKTPYCLGLASERPFFLAGLYADAVPGLRPPTFALLTTQPNGAVAPVHDRMPVMLEAGAADRWLRPGPLAEADYRSLCRPIGSEDMLLWPVSTLVNNPRHETAEVCAPVGA
jgi:putative SOS response-associated peptidase YedK